MFTPKKSSIRFTIAKKERRITSPTIALVSLLFASSVFALSPPEDIQETAPDKNIKKKTTTPKTKTIEINAGRKLWKKPTPFIDPKLLPNTGLLTV
jgi:hypothetical protein